MVAFSERLESSHQIVPAGDAGGDDAFSDTSGDCTLDNSSNRVHGTNYFRLELWWDVESDLLEQILGSTEAANHKNILGKQESASRPVSHWPL